MFKNILLTLLFVSCIQEEKPQNDFTKVLDRLLEQQYLENYFSGSVVVGNSKEILYEFHKGIADRTFEVPISPESRFDIASVNKSFIAGLILLAVEEGEIKLEDKLVGRLNHYLYNGVFDENITIHQLLTHTSGLADYDKISFDLSKDNYIKFKRLHFTNSEYVNFISCLKAEALPNKKFYYSNFGYHLLTIILEDIYQKPFHEILRSKISVPLNMQNTYSPRVNTKVYKNVVKGYQFDEKNKEWKGNHFIDYSLGRRIFSTTKDLYKWLNAFNNNILFNDESLTLLKKNHLVFINSDVSYGYGWFSYKSNERFKKGNLDISLPYIIHGGSTEGYKSIVVNIDNGKYSIAILANTGDKVNELQLAKEIVQLILNSKK